MKNKTIQNILDNASKSENGLLTVVNQNNANGDTYLKQLMDEFAPVSINQIPHNSNAIKASELLQAIVQKGLVFDTQELSTQSPAIANDFFMRLFDGAKRKANQDSISKDYDKTAEILKRDFALDVNTPIYGADNIFTFFMNRSSPLRMEKTLNNLLKNDLVPFQVVDEQKFLLQSAIDSIDNQNFGSFIKAIAMHKDYNFDPNASFAFRIQNNLDPIQNNLDPKTIFDIFTEAGVKCDLNLMHNNLSIAHRIINSNGLQSNNLIEFIKSTENHTIDWTKDNVIHLLANKLMTPVAGHYGNMPVVNYNIHTKSLHDIFTTLLELQKNQFNPKDVLSQFAMIIPMVHNMGDRKYFIKKLAEKYVPFEDVLKTFANIVNIVDILSCYKSMDRIDFDKYIDTTHIIAHGGIPIVGAKSSLIDVIFHCANTADELHKVIKFLIANNPDIDLSKTIKGYSNIVQILSEANHEVGECRSFVDKIKKINEIYNIKIKLKNLSTINFFLGSHTSDLQMVGDLLPENIVSILKDNKIEYSKEMLAIAFAIRNDKLSLSEVSDCFDMQYDKNKNFENNLLMSEDDDFHIESCDLGALKQIIVRADSKYIHMTAAMKTLARMGFNQWNDKSPDGVNFILNIINDVIFPMHNTRSIERLKHFMEALHTITKQNNVKLDFEAKTQIGQDFVDCILDSIARVKIGAESEFVKAEIKNIVNTISKFITNIAKFAKLIDFTKDDFEANELLNVIDNKIAIDQDIQNEKNIMEILLQTVKDEKDLGAFCKTLESKFKINIHDLNYKVGSNQNDVLSYINIPLHKAIEVLYKELSLEDLFYTNENGISTLSLIFDLCKSNNIKAESDLQFIFGEYFNIQNIARTVHQEEVNLKNIKYALSKKDIIVEIAKIGISTSRFVEKLLEINVHNGYGLFNINTKNATDQRLIDVVWEEWYNKQITIDAARYINALRAFGSAEPRNQIINDNNVGTFDAGLDESTQNRATSVKILGYLKTIRMTSDEIERSLDSLYAAGADYVNNLGKEIYGENTSPTLIENIVKALINKGLVYDRINEGWYFKEVIAKLWYILQNKGGEHDQNGFLHCIIELKMCDLGQLINLFKCTHHIITRQSIIDFTKGLEHWFEIFDRIAGDIKSNLLMKDEINFVTKWYVEFLNKPEDYSPEALKVWAIINQSCINILSKKANLNLDNQEPLDIQISYSQNFITLKDSIKVLYERLSSGKSKKELDSVYKLLEAGSLYLIEGYIKKVISSDKQVVEGGNDDITFNPDMLFGNFSFLSAKSIENLVIKTINEGQIASQQFIDCMRLLKGPDQFTFIKEVEEYIRIIARAENLNDALDKIQNLEPCYDGISQLFGQEYADQQQETLELIGIETNIE